VLNLKTHDFKCPQTCPHHQTTKFRAHELKWLHSSWDWTPWYNLIIKCCKHCKPPTILMSPTVGMVFRCLARSPQFGQFLHAYSPSPGTLAHRGLQLHRAGMGPWRWYGTGCCVVLFSIQYNLNNNCKCQTLECFGDSKVKGDNF